MLVNTMFRSNKEGGQICYGYRYQMYLNKTIQIKWATRKGFLYALGLTFVSGYLKALKFLKSLSYDS